MYGRTKQVTDKRQDRSWHHMEHEKRSRNTLFGFTVIDLFGTFGPYILNHNNFLDTIFSLTRFPAKKLWWLVCSPSSLRTRMSLNTLHQPTKSPKPQTEIDLTLINVSVDTQYYASVIGVQVDNMAQARSWQTYWKRA